MNNKTMSMLTVLFLVIVMFMPLVDPLTKLMPFSVYANEYSSSAQLQNECSSEGGLSNCANNNAETIGDENIVNPQVRQTSIKSGEDGFPGEQGPPGPADSWATRSTWSTGGIGPAGPQGPQGQTGATGATGAPLVRLDQQVHKVHLENRVQLVHQAMQPLGTLCMWHGGTYARENLKYLSNETELILIRAR